MLWQRALLRPAIAAVALYLHSASALSVQRETLNSITGTKDPTVLVLGGGVAGVIAARTLTEQGITNFTIVEARGQSGVLVGANTN